MTQRHNEYADFEARGLRPAVIGPRATKSIAMQLLDATIFETILFPSKISPEDDARLELA